MKTQIIFGTTYNQTMFYLYKNENNIELTFEKWNFTYDINTDNKTDIEIVEIVIPLIKKTILDKIDHFKDKIKKDFENDWIGTTTTNSYYNLTHSLVSIIDFLNDRLEIMKLYKGNK